MVLIILIIYCDVFGIVGIITVLIMFIFVAIVTADKWLVSLLQAVPCKTVVVMTTDSTAVQVSQGTLKVLGQLKNGRPYDQFQKLCYYYI